MKPILFTCFPFLLLACAEKEAAIQTLRYSPYDSPLIDQEVAINDPYEIDFDIEKSDDGKFILVVIVKPNGGSFFVSPNSKGDFKGTFRVSLSENEFLELGPDFRETPRSTEVIDNHPFINGSVNWVEVETEYRYPLIINSDEDFVIGAEAAFVIEPKCTLENVYFKIFHSNGELKVELGAC